MDTHRDSSIRNVQMTSSETGSLLNELVIMVSACTACLLALYVVGRPLSTLIHLLVTLLAAVMMVRQGRRGNHEQMGQKKNEVTWEESRRHRKHLDTENDDRWTRPKLGERDLN